MVGCFFLALKGYEELSDKQKLSFIEELDLIYGRRKLFDVVRYESALRAMILQWQKETDGKSLSFAEAIRELRGVSEVA